MSHLPRSCSTRSPRGACHAAATEHGDPLVRIRWSVMEEDSTNMVRSSLFVRWMGVVGVGALAWLPACSGQVDSTGSGGSGAGADGGAGAGADGGAGGEETTTSGSQGGGGTTASSVCSPACDEHTACVEGQCAPIRIASFNAWRLGYEAPGISEELGGVGVCERPSSTPVSMNEILAEEGDCKVVSTPPFDDGDPPGLAEVVAKAASFGTLALAPDGSSACKDAMVDVTPPYLDGETVTFEAAAGVHNPAFVIDATSPPPFTITPGTLVKGQPLEITWEAGGELPIVVVYAPDEDVAIECLPTQGTSLVIGGSLTALLPPQVGIWTLVGILRGDETTLEVSPTYRARASTLRYEYSELDEQP